MHSNKESFGFGQGPQNFDNVSKGDYDDDDDEEEEDYSGVDRQLVRMGYRLLVRGCKGL